MISFDFEKASWAQNSDGFCLQLFVKNRPAALQYLENMKPGRTYTADLKEYHQKRSLDANAYAWVLMSKLAERLTTEAQGDTAYSKDDVYLDMLKRYGQTFVVKVPNGSVEMFKRQYKYCEQHETLPPEERAQYYRVWLGSSDYSSAEMALFINGIISECKEQGLETATPQELARIMEETYEKK